MNNEVTLIIGGGEIKPIITLPSSSTVRELKRKIEEQVGVPVHQQRLLYEDILLLDNVILNDYIHGAMEEVFLSFDLCNEERVIIITVSNENFRIDLLVSKVNKVLDLKEKIGDVFGIEAKDIDLWHMNKKMQDDKMLYKYFIDEGSVVQLTRVGHTS
ncbi:hypothetical protein ACOSP7_002635 [Xanthoceras sorbifolium]